MDNKKIKIAAGIGAVFLILVLAFVTVSKMVFQGSLKNDGGYPNGLGGVNSPMMISDEAISSSSPSPIGRQAVPMMEKNLNSDMIDSSSGEVGATQEKKVIKNGSLTLKVDSIDESNSKIAKIAKDNGGEVFSSNFGKRGAVARSGNVTVKVPVANFEKALAEIKKVASVVVWESTSGTDVTMQYQDLEGRIKNKQAEEEAYKKILDQAQKVDDIISVTRQLSIVRAEIESLQGQLKYLANQTDMSTITATMSEDEDITATGTWRPLQVAKEALNGLLKSSQGFVNLVIVLLITVIPVAILYGILVWVVFRIGKGIYLKIRSKKEEQI